MSESDREKVANKIKNDIVQRLDILDENNVRVTSDIAKYHGYVNNKGFVNRNASEGEIAWWVLVEIPEIPNNNTDADDEDYKIISEIKKDRDVIKSVCKSVSKNYQDVDFIGLPTPSEGFEPSQGGKRYINIRVNIPENK